MILEIFEQLLNARQGFLFEDSVNTLGLEEAFEKCQKGQN